MSIPQDLFSFEINGTDRDLTGYGLNKPNPNWPFGAKVAVSFVLNFEEGAENCILNGPAPEGCQYDHQSEHLLNDTGAPPLPNERHLNIESSYEFGSRAGFHRVLGVFEKAGKKSGDKRGELSEYNNQNGRPIPLTVYSNAWALQKNPEIGHSMVNAGWELATHGYRWIDYQKVSYPVEAEHVQKCVDEQEAIIGYPPIGFYVGRPSKASRGIQMRAVQNANNEGIFKGFLYDNDVYNDDLPYWYRADQIVEKELKAKQNNNDNISDEPVTLPSWARPMLVLPYTLELNDRKFVMAGTGFSCADDFVISVQNAIQQLLHEIDENDIAKGSGPGVPKMLSVGIHCRLSGRPARAYALKRILDWILDFNANYPRPEGIPENHANHYTPIWICRRIDIARHWYNNFYPTDALVPNPLATIDVLPQDFDQYAVEHAKKQQEQQQQ